MSTEQIDHAAEARRNLSVAETGDWETTPESLNSNCIAAAQAYATLALVEQQRAANLIALSGASTTTDETELAAITEIAAALGLGDAS